MKEDLLIALHTLSRHIIEIVREFKKSKRIRKDKRLLIHYGVKQFSERHFNFQPVFVEREIWHWGDLESEIRSLQSYRVAYKIISDNYDKFKAENVLYRFASHIVHKAIEDKLSEEDLNCIIQALLRDLEGKPVKWTVLAMLDGLWVEEEEIDVYEGVKIGRPRPEDLECEQLPELLAFQTFPRDLMNMGFSSVIKITREANCEPEVYYELEKMIAALRLYKLGSIAILGVLGRSESILNPPFTKWLPLPHAVYRYTLSSKDALKLRTFLEKIKRLLPIQKYTSKISDTCSTHILVALQRYNNALFNSNPAERITYGVMGLEALFLRENDELERRLAQRVAKFLSVFKYKPLDVYSAIKDSYSIRSSYVHGSQLGRKKLRTLNNKYGGTEELAHEIMEYLRFSLIAFLELNESVKKERFLKIIDDSMLDQKAFEELKGMVKKYCSATQITPATKSHTT